MFTVRRANLSDVETMADVHVRSWHETYNGLLDSYIIENFSFENRKKMWTAFLQSKTDSQRAYVATNSGKAVGIASWQEGIDHIELVTLYVLAEYQSLGIGKALFRQVIKDASKKNKRLITWVLNKNKAISFYEKMGLKLVGKTFRKLFCSRTYVFELGFYSIDYDLFLF